MESHYWLQCIGCGKKFDEEDAYCYCKHCGSALDVKYDYDAILNGLNVHVLKSAPLRAMKYVDFYPIRDLRKIVTLNEGGTPLYRCENLVKQLKIRRIWAKFEGANPTGAFKDRGTLVEITKAREMEKNTVVCASTGNMAASVTAYCSKGQIASYILVPEGTPAGKLSQTLSYGGRVVQIRGTYDDTVLLTKKLSEEEGLFLAGDYAFRLEGQKSEGYEIVEQLGWNSPDFVFVPVGCGTNASAIWKGFSEFKELDFIGSLPKMVAVQSSSCSPVVDAFETGNEIRKHPNPRTIASAISVGDPLDGRKVLDAIKNSGGCAKKSADRDILEAQKLLARKESLFVEPSAALNLSVLMQMAESGEISPSDEVVLVLTGTGLKDPLTALSVLPSPPVAEPDFAEVKKFLNTDYYKLCAEIATNGSASFILASVPSLENLRSLVHSEFGILLSVSDAKFCLGEIFEFIETKGKKISRNDLKMILEEALQRPHLKSKALEILDFGVTTSKGSKPKAFAKVKCSGKECTKESEGVGPVDAVINAVRLAVEGEMPFKLSDYAVKINTKETDASVDVRMTLEGGESRVTAMGTSPDIILASVKAFEEGYNILHAKREKAKEEGASIQAMSEKQAGLETKKHDEKFR